MAATGPCAAHEPTCLPGTARKFPLRHLADRSFEMRVGGSTPASFNCVSMRSKACPNLVLCACLAGLSSIHSQSCARSTMSFLRVHSLAVRAHRRACWHLSRRVAQVRSAQRPMAFLDAAHAWQIGAPTPSPDGRWMLYTLSTPDWKEAKRQTDIYIVSTEQGVPSTRQLTFTRDKSEAAPRRSPDGKFFVFSSNRDAPASASGQNQLYMMRPTGARLARSPTPRGRFHPGLQP